MNKRNQFIRIGMVFCLTIGILLTTNPARAATWQVCPISCTYTTIGAAVAAATSGDEIDVGSATYAEHDITIGKALTIKGTGSGLVTVDAQTNGRVFIISSGITVTISGMTITNGQATNTFGGGILNNGTLNLDDVIVTNNAAIQNDVSQLSIFGGGIYSAGNLTMTNSQVTNNGSVFSGAGIYLLKGTTDLLTNVLIQNNTISGSAGSGAGIYLDSASSPYVGTLTLDQVTVDQNTATGSGGGIYAQHSASVTIKNSTISNNTISGSNTYGAGLYAEASSILAMSNDTVAGNSAPGGYGGGMYAAGTTWLTNVTVADNTASFYGGLYIGGPFTMIFLSNTILSDNTAPNCGGGFYSYDNNLIQDTIVYCTITGQTANNIMGVSADLAALADNGGKTKTMALLTGSPAIDHGKDATCAAAVGAPNYGAGGLDQRGIVRPQGAHCDMGAYETILIYLPLVMR